MNVSGVLVPGLSLESVDFDLLILLLLITLFYVGYYYFPPNELVTTEVFALNDY